MTLSRIDRRPERTRQALLGAFVSLVLERGYGAVTVDEVVRRSNIGRSSLYVHFGGLSGLLKASLTSPSKQLAALVDQPVTEASLAALLRHFWDQRTRNKIFFVAPIRAVWVRHLADMIEPRLAASADAQCAPLLPWSFVATQVAECQIALVANWLTRRSTTSPDAVAVALIATTRALVRGLACAAPPEAEAQL